MCWKAERGYNEGPVKKLVFLMPETSKPICRRPTPIVVRLPPADSSGFRILNMFDMDSHLSIVKSVVESADSALLLADYSTLFNTNPPKVDLWVWTSVFDV